MHSVISSLAFIALMTTVVVAIAMSLPLVRHIYERPVFLWVSLVSAICAAAILAVAPFRAGPSGRRKRFFLGLFAVVLAFQTVGIYLDRGSPSLFVPSPEVLAFLRELVHIVEYGVLAFLTYRFLARNIGGILLYLTTLACAFIVGIADETVQWLHAFRVGDLRDVMTNGVSASLGLFYMSGLTPASTRHTTAAGRWLAAVLLFLSPVLLVEFYLQTQSGHYICDERRNCFKSTYASSQLPAVAKERSILWSGARPGSLADEEPRFWAWEDYFLTEARAHFRLANEAASAEDWSTACAELHILTTHFAPAASVLGVRLQDYPCHGEPEGFKSQAFGHLHTAAEPAKWRAWAGMGGLALVALGAIVSRLG